MGRSLGSPNKEYRWSFLMYDPTTLQSRKKLIFSKRYTTIQTMSVDMLGCFSNVQLTSYASKSRNCPKNIEIKRICEPVHEYKEHVQCNLTILESLNK